MKSVVLLLKGFCIGVANIIPGVSGGTLAVILQIYYPLIQSISDLTTAGLQNIRKSLAVLVPVLLGAVTGLVLSAKLLERFIDAYYTELSYGFAGLIFGSIPSVYTTLFQKESHPYKRIHLPILILLFLIGAIICIIAPLLSPEPFLGRFAQMSPRIALFFAASIGSATMALPGISGSLVLLLLGFYPLFVSSLTHIDAINIVLIALGAGLGIFGTARFLNRVYKSAQLYCNTFILGLLCASPFALLITSWIGISVLHVTIFSGAALTSFLLGSFTKGKNKHGS